MEAMREHDALTRAQLVRITGLPKSTLRQYTEVLLHRKVLTEHAGTTSGGPGRPASVLTLGTSDDVILALVLSHGLQAARGDLQVGLVTGGGKVVAVRRIAAGGNPMREGIRAARALLTQRGADRKRIAAAVLGVPFALELAASAVHVAFGPQLRVAKGFDSVLGSSPQSELADALGVPVILANDADLGVLGEARWGVGRGARDFAYIKILNGLGVGIIREGALTTAGRVTAGELAHMQVEGGHQCVCGAPSCAGLDFQLWRELRRRGTSFNSNHELISAAAAQDRAALDALRWAGTQVGRAMAATQGLFQPSLIALEAEVGAAHEPLAAGIAQGLSDAVPAWSLCQATVVAARRPDAELRGAAVAYEDLTARLP
jgi:predicted NBD/HSP70 family sugar kinase